VSISVTKVWSDEENVHVWIEPDVSQFVAAVQRALAVLAPVVWRITLARQRDRSRVVTRRKQRRAW